MTDKLKQYIEESKRVLITSHISPDPDAVSSVLLLGTTLALNFPDKQIHIVLEEEPPGFESLEGYINIEFSPVTDALAKHKPDLFILLDGNNYERCSRHAGQEVREYIQSHTVKTVIIDHHELAGADQVDIYINNHSSATVQEVYDICFNQLKLQKPHNYVQTTILGVYADTGGFVYMKDGDHHKLFALLEELISNGANIEATKNLLSRYSLADMQTLSLLIGNVAHEADYTYSFLPDSYIADGAKKPTDMQKATGVFLDEFIRNIDDRQWGFIVYRNILQGDQMYSVSLRSVNGVKDVAKIAESLNGGGHKPAAGGKVQAANVQEAIEKVKAVIAQTD